MSNGEKYGGVDTPRAVGPLSKPDFDRKLSIGERKPSLGERKFSETLKDESANSIIQAFKEPFNQLAHWLVQDNKKKKVYLFNEGSFKVSKVTSTYFKLHHWSNNYTNPTFYRCYYYQILLALFLFLLIGQINPWE